MRRVQASDITVDFPVYGARTRSLKNAMMHAATGGRLARDMANRPLVRALDAVSFELHEGDRVGLAGHNGSGKSTLLRVLAGAYEPTTGALSLRGRVASHLSLSLGMDPEATGYENIVMQGLVAGLTRRELSARADDIASFTELGDFLDMPVRTYSSGMMMRIGFAVATAVEADIVLMDEWIGAADAEFIDKAERRLHAFASRAGVLVVASHSRELLGRLCNKAMLLEHGRLVRFGPVAEVLGEASA